MKKLAGLFLAVALLASFSFAQHYRSYRGESAQVKDFGWRLGPFRIFPVLNIHNTGYDDNVYGQPEEAGPVSDFTGTLAPSVRVYLPVGRKIFFSLTETPQYVYYRKEKKRRRFLNSISPAVRLFLFNRFVISAEYHHRRFWHRATEEFDRMVGQTTKGYSTSLFYETTRRTSIGFTAAANKMSYGDDSSFDSDLQFSRALNRESGSGFIDFYYQFRRETFFFWRGGYTEFSFDSPESKFRGGHAYVTNTGVRFPLTRKIRGTISVGYSKYFPEQEGREEFSGFTGDTNLDIRLRKFAIRLNHSRGRRISYWSIQSYFTQSHYGAGLSYYLLKSLRADYNYGYGRMSYPEPTSVILPGGGTNEVFRKDSYHTHSVGIVFRIIKSTGLGITFNAWRRNSNFPGTDRRRNFIGGFLTHQF